MSATLQRSSWHPAFMPNSLADLAPTGPTQSSIHEPIDHSSLESISERASWHPAFMPNSLTNSKLQQNPATHDPIEVHTDQLLDAPADAPSSEHLLEPKPLREPEESSNNAVLSKAIPHISDSQKGYSEPPALEETSPVPISEIPRPIEPLFEPVYWEEPQESEFALKDVLGIKPAILETTSNDDHAELRNLPSTIETSPASPGGVELNDGLVHNSLLSRPDADDVAHDANSSKADFPTKGPVNELARMSSASFARTVPRDMDWGEDDEFDSEWNLQRSNDDSFKVMAARERTNSFPEVPGARYMTQGSEDSFQKEQQNAEPLRQDLFEDNANSDDFFSKVTEPEIQDSNEFNSREVQWFSNHGAQTADDDFERSYGGDTGGPPDFEARYEEGLPLFGDDYLNLSAPKEQNASPNLFEDEESSHEDDFFSGIGNVESVDQDFGHQKKPSMERKSTIQIMNSLQFPSSDDQFLPVDSVQQDSLAADRSFPLPSEEDLAAKWKAAFDGDDLLDDEEFLDDDTAPGTTSLDPAAFFGSDDEGLLDDDDLSLHDEDQISLPVTETNGQQLGFDRIGASRTTQTNSASRYLPPNAIQPQLTESQPTNQYKLVAPLIGDFSKPIPLPVSSPYGPGYGSPASNSTPPFGVTPQLARPESLKSQSFADKSKGGYSSPYDLPMEVVKPRKRTSMQQLSRGYNNAALVVAPPRSASMYTQAHQSSKGSQGPFPSKGSNLSLSPPAQLQQLHQPGQSPQIPSGPPVITTTLRSKASFFEELPMITKPKSAGRYTPQPASPVDPRVFQSNVPYPPTGQVNTSPQSFDPKATHSLTSHSTGYPSAPPVSHDPQSTQKNITYPPPVPADAHSQSFDSRATQGGAYAPSAPVRPASPVVDPRATDGNAPYVPPNLVAPAKVSPYANLSSSPQPIAPSNRYAPSPSQTLSGSHPPPILAQGRYASAPTNLRSVPIQSPVQPPTPLPHQPRTSSPLAHFERAQDYQSYGGAGTTNGGISVLRKGSSGFDHFSKAPNLPVTKEVEEQEMTGGLSFPPQNRRPHQQYQLNHSSSEVSQHAQEYQHGGNLSPSKRSISGYGSNGGLNQEAVFFPPQRSQTQSPGRVMAGPRADMSIAEPYQRPISVHGPASPKQVLNAYSSMGTTITEEVPKTRPRGFSQGYCYIAPTDGRENDLLQRWRGGPIFAWGVGGTVAMSFPKEVPRYGIGQVQPQILVSPGEVKIRNLKDLYPLDERLASFPGPLKSKSKKKEAVAWLATGIDIMDQENDLLRSLNTLSHEDKRKEERLILWKILRVMIENDGLLEGNNVVNNAVRSVLSPGLDNDVSEVPHNTTGASLTGIYRAVGSITQADPVDSAAVDELRKFLLRGEREKAVWEAVDKRLWAHAMLISNTVSRDLYKQVAQEFVQKEVKSIGENTESLAALYEVFAGNFEESVDELVPPSARAGFQMVSASGTGPSKSSLDGLDRWRETLGLILSNRSENDGQAISALGKLLSGYGRAEAAHICFIFAKNFSEFGGVDNPLSDIVLVGSDHLRQRHEFDKEMEPMLLSEVYEFGLTLSNTSNTPLSLPHLAVYKLQHATILAQFGQREKALQYCEVIDASIYSQTRRSPYHSPLLESALIDLRARLKASAKDESSSWISKPSMDKVSTSVWTKFNKFVAGEENDANAAPGSEAGSDIGPFSRIAGGTPTISRSPSNADLYGSYNGGPPNGAVPPLPATRAASRYAPGSNYNPATTSSDPSVSSYGSPPQSSSFGQRRSFEDRRSTEEPRVFSREVSAGSYKGGSLYAAQPNQNSSSAYSLYVPSNQASYGPSQPQTPTHDQPTSHIHESPQSLPSSEMVSHSTGYGISDSYNPNTGGYTPQGQSGYSTPPINADGPPSTVGYNNASDNGHGRTTSTVYEPPSSEYEPPLSSGYEPPSYEPNVMKDEPDSPIDAKSKNNSIMNDDDDQPASQPREKTKAEKDREADEAFRRAAEADAQKEAPAPAAKKGWGLGGWFGGAKKDTTDTPQPNKAIKAKLGEESSFFYDPELKRWVNKKAGKDGTPERASSTPPPPKGPPRTASLARGIPTSTPRPNVPLSNGSAPPPQGAASTGGPPEKLEDGHDNMLTPPAMIRTISGGNVGPPSGPPSRPSTSMSNASSIDDLLGPPAARKGGAKKAKKGRGYIDVMGDKK